MPRNTQEELRAIGTEFWDIPSVEEQMNNSSTVPKPDILYRVREHVVTSQFWGDTDGVWSEILDPIEIREN